MKHELSAFVTESGLWNKTACGQTLSEYVTDAIRAAGIEAVSCGEAVSSCTKPVLVVPGNMPFLAAETLRELIARHAEGSAALTELEALDEDGISTPVGVYIVSPAGGSPEEAYKKAKERRSCASVYLQEDIEALRIDSMQDMLYCRKELQQRINNGHLERGADILDPDTAYIGAKVRIGAGSVIEPNVMIDGETVIGENTVIGMGSKLTDAAIGNDVTIQSSVLVQSTVEDGARIGPFAYLRPNSRIGKNAKIGDFVEVKNSVIGEQTSVAHLTYIGDSDVGAHVNFGCGCVTVNYDGKNKYRCHVGDHAFVGCNTNLVAPVNVGQGAYIAAGSTITDEVPEGALSIARARQINKENWKNDRRK